MDALCPECQQAMQWQKGHFICEACHKSYQQQALCPECHQPLEELKACGAVDYFCRSGGHGMVSKRRVVFTYQLID